MDYRLDMQVDLWWQQCHDYYNDMTDAELIQIYLEHEDEATNVEEIIDYLAQKRYYNE